MGFSPDDVLVEDCGVVPGWIHRNLEILRQLDCRASIFDHEVRRAMLEMIKISSSNKSAVTSSIFRKRGKIIDAKSDTQDFNNNDTLRFSSCDEPPTKRRRCDQLSIESFHQLGKFHTDTSTTDDSTEMSTTPDSSSLSPSLSPQIHISQHPVHHKLRRQTPSRVSPSTSTHCSDATSSPDSFVSSSPLTPNDHLPSEEPLPASQHQPFDTSSQQPECAPCLTSELPLIDPHRVNQTPFGLEASISSTLEDCSNGSEPPAALSAARYLLGRKRALLVQKLSLLRQGSLVVKQEHARLIQRHNSTTQQQGTTNVSGTTTPAESSCSASTRRLRSSTHAHHHNFGAVSTRAATTAHSTRFQAQQQTSQLVADAPVEVKPEPDKRRTRTGSINSSSGSNSGASTLTRLRNRKSTILSSASTASSSASLPHQVSLQPDKLDRSASRQTPDRFPVAHRSHPPTPKRQPSSTPLESPDVSSRHHSALSSTIEGSATTPTNLSQSTSQHVNPTQSSLVTVNSSTVQSPSPQTAAAVKPSSHTVSYEPLNPSTSATISSSSPPTDSNTETAKATINGEFGNQSANASFRRNVDTASAHTASTSTFFDAHNHSSHHYPNNVPPPHMGNDPLSFLAAAYSSHPLSHSHLLQRPFGLYDHTAPPPIAYSTPGIVASQDPIQSLYSSDPSTLFHQQHRSDHQLIGISHPPSGVSQSTPPSSVTAPSKATNSIKSSKRSSHHSDRTNGHATPSSSSESASNHYSFISTNSPSGYPLHPQPAVSQQLQHSSNYNTKSHRDPFGGQTFITPSTNQNTSINNEQQQSEHRNDVICNSNNAASITKGTMKNGCGLWLVRYD